MKKLYIYGASGHGLVVADIAQVCGYDIIWVDDGQNEYNSFDMVNKDISIPWIVAVGNNGVRAKLIAKLKEYGCPILTLIHPSAIISKSANISEGVVVMPKVVINAKSQIGTGAIINTSSVVEHENSIGEYVHISPGVSLAGKVTVGAFSHVGIGSTVKQGISIGSYTVIGAGSVVVQDIGSNVIAYGNPCRVQEGCNE